MKKPVALTIAGSDPCAGAGIQADLKTFSAFGVYGVCALTAVTSQNTMGVQDVYPLPPRVVGRQLDSVLADIDVGAVKTGMLWNGGIISEIAGRIRKHNLIHLVVDPVLCAGDGSSLLQREAFSILKQELLPLAYLITPNINEAEALCGFKLSGLEDMRSAAKKIKQMGCPRVLIKGGHLPGEEVVDLLYDGEEFSVYTHPRLEGIWHGTGCTQSAAITAGLARGKVLSEAVKAAIDYTVASMQQAISPGEGSHLLIHRIKSD